MNSKFSKIFILVLTVGLVASCAGESDEISSGSSSGSLGDSSPTNIISGGEGFFMAFESDAFEVYDQTEVIGEYLSGDKILSYPSTVTEATITIYADDENDLRVSGKTVNFKTEWGTFLDGYDSCVLSNGSCTVTWQSGSPSTAPTDCRVAFTAWAVGEETFVDENANGYYDLGEAYYESEEPFLDIDHDGQYDSDIFSYELIREIIDIIDYTGDGDGLNAQHDSGDSLYNGRLCNSGCGSSSTILSDRATVIIQSAFTDADDIDNDNDDEEIMLRCNDSHSGFYNY